jgi:glycyl-tRNA synthetase
MHEFIVNEIPNNPNSKKEKAAEWTEVRKFQMMFYTYQGVVHDDADSKIWMRPETAQGIFVNFRNVLDTTRMRVPFGIAQVGKAFRNEITPGNFLYRTREFEQMEIEYFVSNEKEEAMKAFEDRKAASKDRWENKIQLTSEKIRFREHESDELSHYSDGTFDVEFQYPRGW